MTKEPSQTALTAAAARAAHLIVDHEPLIFRDPLAHTLLGDRAEELIDYHRAHGEHLVLSGARTSTVTRSRCTEDRLADAIARGITQYVILGAGLDTFAYRSEHTPYIQIFEVDHPATQEWKRRRLADAGIAVPPTLTFVPADLEAEPPTDALARAGLDPARPAFVSWLGVTMYLTREAIDRTLAPIGELSPGTEVIVDHVLPAELRDADGRAYVEMVMPFAAGQGEPWLTCLGPRDMASLLAGHGFEVAEQLGQRDSVDPALWSRTDALRPAELMALTRARVSGGRG